MCPSHTSVHSADAKIEKELMCAEMAQPEGDSEFVTPYPVPCLWLILHLVFIGLKILDGYLH